MIPIEMLTRLHNAIIAAGVPIAGLNLHGIVNPTELQKDAQPIIDAFDVSPATQDAYEKIQQDAQVKAILDGTDKSSPLHIALGKLVQSHIETTNALNAKNGLPSISVDVGIVSAASP